MPHTIDRLKVFRLQSKGNDSPNAGDHIKVLRIKVKALATL